MAKEIMGFYPNWLSPDLYLSLNYSVLSTIAWAFLGLQSDGSLIKQSYPPTSLINYAHSKGKKVVVSINPGWGSPVINTILASSSLQNTVINNLVYEVRTHGFDGVDIDFEGFPAINTVNGQSNRALFTQFITSLSQQLHSINGNYQISIDVPPIDWNNVYDTGVLSSYINYVMMMCYDYHWQTGPTAGAVAPLTSPNGQSVTNTVNTYLQTVPANKLLLGVPYYGYEWQTQNQQPDSPTIGGGIAVKYSEIPNKISVYGRNWNSTWSSPYYLTSNGQGWFDDTDSLSLKYDLVNSRNLAGIGIWALGYDTPYTELSTLILNKFNGAGGGTCPSQDQINILGVCTNKIGLIIAGAAFIGFITVMS